MTGETRITVIGNLTADPELNRTQSGPVANFTIASTNRVFDRDSNEWKNGDTLFLRSSIWRDYAEHVVASLTKGMKVIAYGVLKQRSYETREGEKRTEISFDVEEIGPALRNAVAHVQRADGDQRTLNRQEPVRSPREQQPAYTPQAQPQSNDDYWANDETPF